MVSFYTGTLLLGFSCVYHDSIGALHDINDFLKLVIFPSIVVYAVGVAAVLWLNHRLRHKVGAKN